MCGIFRFILRVLDHFVIRGKGAPAEKLRRDAETRRLPCRKLRRSRYWTFAWWQAQVVSSVTVAPLAKTNERGGKIIHVELRFHAIGKAPAALAQSAIAELRVGRARHRYRLEIIDRPQTEIEHVHADIVERSTAGDFLVAEPGAQFRDAGAATARSPSRGKFRPARRLPPAA